MVMMLRGMQSDPNQPGTEKLVITEVNDKWLTENRVRISSADVGADANLLSPQAAFAVKGWNRSVCCLSVLLAVFEMPLLLEAGCLSDNSWQATE